MKSSKPSSIYANIASSKQMPTLTLQKLLFSNMADPSNPFSTMVVRLPMYAYDVCSGDCVYNLYLSSMIRNFVPVRQPRLQSSDHNLVNMRSMKSPIMSTSNQ